MIFFAKYIFNNRIISPYAIIKKICEHYKETSSPRTISNAMFEEFRIAFPYLTGDCEIEDNEIDEYFPTTIRTVSVGH